MAVVTWVLAKDTTVAGGVVDSGDGLEQHAPIGLYAGIRYRHFAQFAVATAGMTAIGSALLHVRSSPQVHVAYDRGFPIVLAARVSSAWVGSGGTEGAWSTTADPKDSTQPSVAGSEVSTSIPNVTNMWSTIDITAIAQAWLAGSANYGIRLRSGDEAGTSATWEAWAMASSSPMFITVSFTPTAGTHAPTANALAPLTGYVADMNYVPGSGAASPWPVLSWTYGSIDNRVQTSYQVIVYNDAGGSVGSLLWDSGQVTSGATSVPAIATYVEGNYYHWKVKVWDPSLSSAFTATERFRVRWGAAEYVRDLGSIPNSWSVTSINSTGIVVVEYDSSTDSADPGANIGGWMASLASVVRRRFFRYRVWLLPVEAALPSLDALVLAYNVAGQPNPDNWLLSPDAVPDVATKVYGVRSLRIDSLGSDERTSQLVTVIPNTNYYLHGQIRQSALGIGAYIALGQTATGGELVRAIASTLYTDWTEVGTPWFSGANTSVFVQCGASGTGTSWFDALKLEASADPTLWLPSVLSEAVVLDGSGLKIDGAAGGSLRVRGTLGGVRDEIKLDQHGLLFGGDTTLYSSAPVTLRTDGSFSIGNQIMLGADWKMSRTAVGIAEMIAGNQIHSFGEGWLAPTLSGTWVNYGGTFATAGYRIDAQGYVHLRGLVKSGGTGVVFTLPVGYRPAADDYYAGSSLTGSCSWGITSAGLVTAATGWSATWSSMGGITFKAV